MNELQSSLIETIKLVAGERLKNVNFTKSYTGIAKSVDLENLIAVVEIGGTESECIIPYNLRNYIWTDDIVIVQDIANNNRQKIVQGTVATQNGDMFHIYDPVADVIVSSVEQLWDEELQMVVNVTLEYGE